MEFINKLEGVVAGWAKNVPHLPVAGQKWLANNVWWIVLVGAIVSGISILFAIGALFALIAIIGTASSLYYVNPSANGLGILSAIVALVFSLAQVILLAAAVKPLKAVQKKGWVILFVSLLVQALAVVVNAVLSFSIAGFLLSIIFGAIGLAIGAYFLYEIRGQFAIASKPVAKTAKKA